MKITEDPPNNCDRDSASHPRLVMPRLPVPGWQWAKCDDCGTTWKETSRDILSPSHVDCPNHCDHGGDTHVWKTEQADLPRDQNGNLLKYETEILTRGLGHNRIYSPENFTDNPENPEPEPNQPKTKKP